MSGGFVLAASASRGTAGRRQSAGSLALVTSEPSDAPAAARSALRSARGGRRGRLGMIAVIAVLASSAAACGNSADPDTWAEAEQGEHEIGDSAVETNFMNSCVLANEQSELGDLTGGQALVLCRCAFDGLRTSLTLQEFKALDKALRATPNPSDLDEEPEDLWDDVAEGILENCARRVDA